MILDWNTDSHGYQRSGASHLWNSASTLGVAAVWLDPGYGKTSIVLHTFKALFDAGLAKNMLIVAPLRVAQTVWAQEIENWSSLAGLKACRLHGRKKEKWLSRKDVNVWIINYEGLQWLGDMAKSGKLPFAFDVVCFDEVRRMKSSQGKRFKAAKPIAAMAKYKWGLTGTPASNGLMDLFGQFLILDEGAALGNRITKFRHEFFEKGWDGFTWTPRPGAKEAIESRIAHYVFRADGHLNTPPTIPDDRIIELSPKGRKAYNAMKRDLITQIEGDALTAANAAVLYGKLKQMANGRIYDEKRNIIEIHDAKKEALYDLVEELGDEQLLIAIDFHHDLDQIREILGDRVKSFKDCSTSAQAEALQQAWNNREVQFIADHPDSIGHGLNLQKGGAHHILWWSPTVNLDHWIQFNQRLDRQGNPAETIVIHQFIAAQTVNESDIKSRGAKDDLQSSVLNALTTEFGDSITLYTEIQETNMELQFQADAAQQQQPAQPAATQNNPFANGGQANAPAPQAAPQQPVQTQAAPPNPFGGGDAPAAQPQQAANPQPQPDQGAPANPFNGGQAAAPNPQQQQAIQQEVAAPPPTAGATVQNAPANPFDQANAAASQQAAQTQQPVEDAQVVSETPPPAQTAAPVQETAPAPTSTDSGWKEPEQTPVPAVAGAEGYVVVNMMVPESKHADVIASIGRVLKKKD